MPVICLAFFPDGNSCRIPAEAGSRWCPLHSEQQAKTLKAYKRYTGALAAFDDGQLCGSPLHASSGQAAVTACEDLDQLIAWQRAAREKWKLAERVIQARLVHHNRFCRGGDAGHVTFIETLDNLKTALEAQVAMLDARAYVLVLQKQEADWLLAHEEEVGCEAEAEDAHSSPSSDSLASPRLAPSSDSALSDASTDDGASDTATESDCDSDCESDSSAPPPARMAEVPASPKTFLLARLRSHFDDPAGESDGRATELRRAVIDQLFRFVIARTPSLLVKALAVDANVEPQDFITDDLPLESLMQLERGLRFGAGGLLGPHVLRNAITSIDRCDANKVEDKIHLLGKCWYRKAVKRSMTVTEWQLFHEFVHCSGCALKVTRCFDEWLLWRSEAHAQGLMPHYADPTATFCDAAMDRAGVGLLRVSEDAKRSLERVQPKSRKMSVVYIEKDARCWVYLRFSRNQCKAADKAIKALEADQRFDCLQSTADDKRKPWTTRLRSGLTPASRRAASFTADRHFCSPHAFEILGSGRFVGDTLDLIVLSRTEELNEKSTVFAQKVCAVVLPIVQSL